MTTLSEKLREVRRLVEDNHGFYDVWQAIVRVANGRGRWCNALVAAVKAHQPSQMTMLDRAIEEAEEKGVSVSQEAWVLVDSDGEVLWAATYPDQAEVYIKAGYTLARVVVIPEINQAWDRAIEETEEREGFLQ